ncbi:MAG TPA: alpha/beta hydrolase [Candidatus Angelobacter sp.]|nr:alpha/beta hydrolase [Candidatus Angelobacter sp.]
MRLKTWITAFLLLPDLLCAQDITGKWQGTLDMGQRHTRVILKIEKANEGGLQGRLYMPEGSPDFLDWGADNPLDSVTLQGANLKFSYAYGGGGTFAGRVSADGLSIQGTWAQGRPLPLKLERATPATEWKDPYSHTVQFITVDKGVQLEVVDWGGSGRPLVFLAGGGLTAHSHDRFAPKFTGKYHAYGITRRGFGDSSSPGSGYSADRLGDDVIAVLDALKLNRPVLIGQSIAGEEMSSVASRHPERVAGLVYLDAGYSYAFYDSSRGDPDVDIVDLRNKLEQFKNGKGPEDLRPLIQELLEKDLPGFERDLRTMQKDLEAELGPENSTQLSRPVRPPLQAMFDGFQKYTQIPVPILNIYAVPHDFSRPGDDPKERAAIEARDEITTGAQADAFAKGVPSARVVRLPHARHNVIASNEADVLREMNSFLAGLP